MIEQDTDIDDWDALTDEEWHERALREEPELAKSWEDAAKGEPEPIKPDHPIATALLYLFGAIMILWFFGYAGVLLFG